ncbi:HAD family hydrolase [Allorhodopirellula solitaria]|uniref:Malto-oligosyltrehalose trehalohydrolase n=1 Tax=Allorhodopirellula solitaria TaxID=2527987 RepID=A0A5C5YBL9_9BACT|nr:HAD family hydrolase [Allorhodopirellula solitaria]TWT73107.1 Malto-oligosyltrehalose trehalohydrolase [Allorhodopirellula solitaria]
MTTPHRPHALATDLDGTFIPLNNDSAAEQALEQIRDQFASGRLPLAFVTGRHFDFVLEAIVQEQLPQPDWILCDVGTSVYERVSRCDGERGAGAGGGDAAMPASGEATAEAITSLAAEYRPSQGFADRLDEIVGEIDIEHVRREIAGLPGFRLQEPVKQKRHKLSYYVAEESLEDCHVMVEAYLAQHALPYGVISSVDPFNGDGLVDVLPANVSKAFALDWWCHDQGYRNDEVVFCGDSGNDYAALVAGYRAVVVANADRRHAARVHDAHMKKGWSDRLLLASQSSTAGVLEGLRWFGWKPEDSLAGETSVVTDQEPAFPLAWGAVPVGHRRTQFTVFAPAHESLTLEIQPNDASAGEPRSVELTRNQSGFFTACVDECPVGTDYRLRIGSQAASVEDRQPSIPDPASRYQPAGVHGPSRVVSQQFPWQHDDRTRCERREELVIYELHIGAFTKEGTFTGAIERLDELVELGITAIELMPIAQCPGRWNWGYDATHWFAPMNAMGTPDDLRGLVDAAHARGLHVFADVVYNHFGPEGNYWSQLGDYFSTRHDTPWGASPNFDAGDSATAIRRLVIDNAIYWLDEFHLDGLRVDAIHCMRDHSEEHITRQFGREVRQWSERAQRRVWLIAETNVYDGSMTAPLDENGCGFDAQWGDDFAHALLACVRSHDRLTVRTYQPHEDLARALQRGYVFRGDVGGDRGREELGDATAQRVDTSSVVYCIQNHDFIGNHPLGQRFHQITAPETQAAAATLLLLSPAIPMLFMGEEFACENPFAFFVDFGDESLRQAVVEGRRHEYPQHDWSGGVLPTDEHAFESARIGAVAAGNLAMHHWYRELIAVRREFTQSGLLAGEHLIVRTDTERGCYALQFRRGEEQLIVVCRLADPSQSLHPNDGTMSGPDIAEFLQINGELPPLLLDSRAALSGDPNGSLELHFNHAVVLHTS